MTEGTCVDEALGERGEPRWRPKSLGASKKGFSITKILRKSLRQKSMLLCVGARSVGRPEAGANTVPNSNLKIWNWYKLLTLWKVVLIDLYALLSNSLYCEHESATFLEAAEIFFEITVSIADFQNSFVPEFCVNANNYVEGSEGRSRILDVIIFIGPYPKTNKLDSQP